MKIEHRSIDKGALVIFVKKFQGDKEKVTLEDVKAVASNVGDVAEVVSVTVTLNTSSAPGTFSVTIFNHNEKFTVLDNPDNEIKKLREFSSLKRYFRTTFKDPADKSGALTFASPEPNISAAYPYSSLEDWMNKPIVYIEEGSLRRPTYTSMNEAGAVVERWSFDAEDNIVILSRSQEEDENLINALKKSTTITKSLLVINSVTKRESKKTFNIGYVTNSSLVPYLIEDGKYINGRGRVVIEPMDRVVIFLPAIIDGKVVAQRVFTGVVSEVTESYRNAEHYITVSGEDVTKYLHLSVVNVNPSFSPYINPQAQVLENARDYPTIWKNVLSGKSPIELIKALLLGDQNLRFGQGNTLTGVGEYVLSHTSPGVVVYDPDSDSWYVTQLGGSTLRITFEQALGELFKRRTVHIFDFFSGSSKLTGFDVYRLGLSTGISFYQNAFYTRRELLYQFARDVDFVFYADENGELWFHPPRLSLDHILCLKDPSPFIIQKKDTIEYSLTDTDRDLATYVVVSTEPPLGYSGVETIGGLQGSALSELAIMKYGIRILMSSNPLISKAITKSTESGESSMSLKDQAMLTESAAAYAKSLLKKILASKNRGAVTIPGRANLKVGFPVFLVDRNMVYYIESLTHSYSYGNSFTTSLNLSYGRKAYEYVAEVLTFSKNDDLYLTDSHILAEIPKALTTTKAARVEVAEKKLPDYAKNESFLNKCITLLRPYKSFFVDASNEFPFGEGPEFLMALSIKESTVGTNPMSKKINVAGALGMMQIIASNAKNFIIKNKNRVFRAGNQELKVSDFDEKCIRSKPPGDPDPRDIRLNPYMSIYIAAWLLADIKRQIDRIPVSARKATDMMYLAAGYYAGTGETWKKGPSAWNKPQKVGDTIAQYVNTVIYWYDELRKRGV